MGGKATTVSFEEERDIPIEAGEKLINLSNGLIFLENVVTGVARSIFVNEKSGRSILSASSTTTKPGNGVAEDSSQKQN